MGSQALPAVGTCHQRWHADAVSEGCL